MRRKVAQNFVNSHIFSLKIIILQTSILKNAPLYIYTTLPTKSRKVLDVRVITRKFTVNLINHPPTFFVGKYVVEYFCESRAKNSAQLYAN